MGAALNECSRAVVLSARIPALVPLLSEASVTVMTVTLLRIAVMVVPLTPTPIRSPAAKVCANVAPSCV
jgi:hypothetical protein